MSRRKQSAPCKVQGLSSSKDNYQHETSEDIVKLHSLTDSLLESNAQLTKTFLSRDYNPVASLPSESSFTNPAENNLNLLCPELNYVPEKSFGLMDNVLPPWDNSAIQIADDFDGYYPQHSADSLGKGSPDLTQQRSSIDLLAKLSNADYIENVDDEGSALPLKRKHYGPHTNILDKHELYCGEQKRAEQLQISQRSRTASSEEELMCPICHKGFKSKYGLLTHAEIHAAPDLRCPLCDLGFSTRADMVDHQASVHSNKENTKDAVSLGNKSVGSPFKKYKAISGFSDLSFIDFTCNKFSAISEGICSKSLHRLTGRDRRHFFLCKACELLFPTLSSLNFHLEKSHKSPPSTVNSTTTLPEENESEINREPIVFDEKDLSFLTLASSLGLNKNAIEAEKVGANAKNHKTSVNYATDDSSVRTSPMIAYLEVPKWMRNANEYHGFCDEEVEKDFALTRPPLKMKLVRCRGDEGEKLRLVANKDFFQEDEEVEADLKEDNEEMNEVTEGDSANNLGGCHTCENCGDTFAKKTALECHKAASMCGIGIKTSSSGKRMFWCRLCNYASFEKSTILRHQRTHTGVRPYSCKLCSIAFTTKANCERHIKKRHRLRINGDVDVKNAVFCDYDLLRKAREGEINLSASASSNGNNGSRFFSFVCRICKADFNSRSSGVRHVMGKHSILDRKTANETIIIVRSPDPSHDRDRSVSSTQQTGEKISEVPSDREKNLKVNSFAQRSSSTSPFMMKPSKIHRPPLKPPTLIPLLKIKAYYESSKKMFDIFRKDYSDVLSFVDKRRQDTSQLTTKLLSLLGASSSTLKRKRSDVRPYPHSSFTPVSSMPTTSVFQSIQSLERRNNSGNSFRESYHSFKEAPGSRSLYANQLGDDFQDVTQQLTNMEAENAANSDGNGSGEVAPISPVKNTSTLMLRHFAALSDSRNHSNSGIDIMTRNNNSANKSKTDLASVDDLVNMVQKPAFTPMREPVPSKPDFAPSGVHRAKRTNSGLRGKYRMVMTKPKPSQSSGSGEKPAMTWRFIPNPPRQRDENGRYVRNSFPTGKSSKPTTTSYHRNDDDRPTMISMLSGKVSLPVDRKRGPSLFMKPRSLKGRKCPICNKVFPWASSLSRHIMTHSGVKPYMCAKCGMKFTTRSNLLRHAYRRHGLERGSEERHKVLVTLTPSEQKEHAATEVRKALAAAKHSAAMREQAKQDDVAEDDDDADVTSSAGVEVTNNQAKMDEEVSHYNKRYICGLCRLPFANRSNLVRHLHRLHGITKDHPDFKGLLVKIKKPILGPTAPSSSRFLERRAETPPPPTPPPQQPDSPVPSSTSSPQINGHTPSHDQVNRFKAFTCAICNTGFTKRNNAARHIQQQHRLNRKAADFHKNILRNFPTDNEQEMNSANVSASDEFKSEADTIETGDREDNDVSTSSPATIAVKEEPQDAADLPLTPDRNVGITQEESHPPMLNDSSASASLSNWSPQEDDLSSNMSWRNRKRSLSLKKLEQEETKSLMEEESPVPMKPRKKDIRMTQFVCGVCKRIYKEVEDLKKHLDDHNVPHPWHCTICGVPFTNKYNCQRHLIRRHGATNVVPKYVEDRRVGPARVPRRKSRSHR